MGKKAEPSLTHLLLFQEANSNINSNSPSKCPIFWIPYNTGTPAHYIPEISSAAHHARPPASFSTAGIAHSEFAVGSVTLSSPPRTSRKGSTWWGNVAIHHVTTQLCNSLSHIRSVTVKDG